MLDKARPVWYPFLDRQYRACSDSDMKKEVDQ